MVTGWFTPSDVAVAHGAVPAALDWLGLVLICFVLPGVLSQAFALVLRKIG